MSTKELAMESIRDLPEDASWEQIEERIHFLAAIEAAREDVKSEKVMPHSEVADFFKPQNETEYLLHSSANATRLAQGIGEL
ncbi:MAG: hypothetical protein NWQ16_13685 [Akkermansiaceae bacterium]|jgi:hypothetical protein|nr:hypothetical protein [Akkermansiaceae bacterium]